MTGAVANDGPTRNAGCPADFWSRGYALADGLVGAADRAFAKAAMDTSLRGGRMGHAAKGVALGTMNEYSPIAGEAILARCRPAIERVVGKALLPTYAFWRIYGHGDKLTRHTDRPACEVSATVAIFAEPATDGWPIFVCDLHGAEHGVALRPGQAVVYQGCRVPHWREPFTGMRQYQLFLHYVVEGGERAAQAFDGRGGDQLTAGSVRERGRAA